MDENENKNNDNDFEPRDFMWYVREYLGAIIGALVAIILIVTGLSNLIIGLIIIVFGAFVGNYVQKNKSSVKEKLKGYIDKF